MSRDQDHFTPPTNHVRNHWRSVIVGDACRAFGHTAATFEPILAANKRTLGESLRELLDDLEAQERNDGRTHGQGLYVQRRCEELARMNPHLRTARAPRTTEALSRPAEDLFV